MDEMEVCCYCGDELSEEEIADNERNGDSEMPSCFECLDEEQEG
jgi:hypothetical protein